jgi:hypothetical protein
MEQRTRHVADRARYVAPLRADTRPHLDGERIARTMSGEMDPFVEVMTELSDGSRWKLASADGWDDFIDRLSRLLPDLPLRRRQALIMLLFALTEKLTTPDQLSEWLAEHDATSEAGLEEFVGWLRSFRRPGELT